MHLLRRIRSGLLEPQKLYKIHPRMHNSPKSKWLFHCDISKWWVDRVTLFRIILFLYFSEIFIGDQIARGCLSELPPEYVRACEFSPDDKCKICYTDNCNNNNYHISGQNNSAHVSFGLFLLILLSVF